MRVDLPRVQQASAMANDSDSDLVHEELPPEWNRREESFDDFIDRAHCYTHRPNQELPRRWLSSLPSPFLKDGERRAPEEVPPNERLEQPEAPPRRRKRLMMSMCPPPRKKGVLSLVDF